VAFVIDFKAPCQGAFLFGRMLVSALPSATLKVTATSQSPDARMGNMSYSLWRTWFIMTTLDQKAATGTTGKNTKKTTAGKTTNKATTADKTKTVKTAAASSPAAAKSSGRKPRRATLTRDTGVQPAPVTREKRHSLIAEAAYLRAERRGFSGGDPVEDWLLAEREVDARIQAAS